MLETLAGLRPIPEGVPQLVTSASGAPASGIETVTGVPIRCMNRVERLVALLAARRPEPVMTVARSVADVLDEHVVFEVESIDRMYLNVWQPRLAYGGGVQGFFVGHRGHHYASTALMDPMTKDFVANIHGFVAARGLELVHFAKGQRKDDLAQQMLARFPDTEGVLFVGRAQEKAGVWRTQRRYNPVTGGSYAWLVRSTAFINFFYFYCVDADFGPFFLKFSTYFPYTAKLCINGNEWAKRQAAKAGILFEPLDNGFAAIDDPADVAAVQQICDSLGPEHIDALLRKWLAVLPHPFAPEDETAGYRYELSILQAGKMTYDLRRLRAHGLIARIPRTRRYQITDTGLTRALLFTHAHDHLLRVGLAEITDPDPPAPSRLRAADRAYQTAFDELARDAHLAA